MRAYIPAHTAGANWRQPSFSAKRNENCAAQKRKSGKSAPSLLEITAPSLSRTSARTRQKFSFKTRHLFVKQRPGKVSKPSRDAACAQESQQQPNCHGPLDTESSVNSPTSASVPLRSGLLARLVNAIFPGAEIQFYTPHITWARASYFHNRYARLTTRPLHRYHRTVSGLEKNAGADSSLRVLNSQVSKFMQSLYAK